METLFSCIGGLRLARGVRLLLSSVSSWLRVYNRLQSWYSIDLAVTSYVSQNGAINNFSLTVFVTKQEDEST